MCHNSLGIDHNLSPTIPTSSTSSSSPVSCPMPSNSSITILSNKSSNSPYNRSYSSCSTPSTPNMSRLRTLTCTYIYLLFCFPILSIKELRYEIIQLSNYMFLASGDLIISKRINGEFLSVDDGKKSQNTRSFSCIMLT